MAFAVAFFGGAVAVFALVGVIGGVLVTAEAPRQWRLCLGATGLLTLAMVDIVSMRRMSYCPLGWRRQTPRVLLRRHPQRVVAAIWGLDTGLGVTTIRVAGITWGALLVAALGLSPPWAGLGYALGFNGPFLILLWRHRVGPSSRCAKPADPGLESLLAQRPVLQRMSAILLACGGCLLIGSAIV
jgi:hypothetical protein